MDGKYVVSWSGGKDSALAFHKAQSIGMKISHLFTVFSPDKFTMSHRIPRKVVQKQAEALGIPLVEGVATWETYEREFKRVLSSLKKKGVTGCIFGDIDIDDHIAWCRKVCTNIGLSTVHPLYGSIQEHLLNKFIELGFQALIIVVKQDKLGSEWLGKKLSKAAIREFKTLGISVGGEFGEYHTLVTNGPIFQRAPFEEKLKSFNPKILTRQGYAFWDLTWDLS